MVPQEDTSGWSNEDWLSKRYHYIPSFTAAVIFASLFGLSTAAHLLQLIRKRAFYFTPFLVGGLFETAGYILRALDTKFASKLLFINQTSVILLAPALYAASIYIILKRMIIITNGHRYSLVRVDWLTRVFVGSDVLSFLLQGAGGAMQASNTSVKPGRQELGKYLVIGGLLVQLVVFSFFVVVVMAFHYRIRRRPTASSTTLQSPWLRCVYALYFGSLLIMIRSTFRVIEYSQGQNGFIMSHEFFSYMLDAAMMLMVSAEFNLFHPAIVLLRGCHEEKYLVDGTC